MTSAEKLVGGKSVGEGKELVPIVIKAGVVENLGDGVPDRGDRADSPEFGLLDAVIRRVHLNQFPLGEQPTRILLATIRSLPPQVRGSAIRQGGFLSRIPIFKRSPKPTPTAWDPDDVAACMTFRACGSAAGSVPTQLSGVAIVDRQTALGLYEGIFKDPFEIFRLVETVNNGPVQEVGKSPAIITTGTRAIILPNIGFGGALRADLNTNQFAPNRKPGPQYEF